MHEYRNISIMALKNCNHMITSERKPAKLYIECQLVTSDFAGQSSKGMRATPHRELPWVVRL